MSNIISYTLQLNDRMSQTLSRIGASTGSTAQDVRNLRGEVQGLNNISLGGFFSSISKIAGVLGIGAMLGKTIKSGMEQEMRNTSFEVLFGGANNAKKMIDDISSYAAKSPYGKQGLSEATQMMAGFGIEQDKIIPNLKMIGDIAMGSEDKFNSLSLAFSQMSSTGKLTGQDLLQMINAGFNPLDQMAKTTGKSISQLKDLMGKGAISSDMVTKAFQDATKEGGLYYGMIDKINNTASGQWSAAMDNISEILLGLYSNVIQPVLLPALKAVNAFLDENGSKLMSFFSSISTTISGLFGKVMENSSSVMSAISPLINIVQDVFYTFQELFSIIQNGNIGVYFQAVADLLSNYIVPLISQLWNFIKDIVLKVVDFVSKSTLLRDIWLGIVDFAKALVEVVSWVIDKLKWLFDNVVMPILNAIEMAYRLISGSTPSKVEIVTKSPVQSITPPAVPGTTGTATAGAGTGISGGTGTSKAGKDTAKSIATGGTKTTNITVNVAQMGNDMKIYVDSLKEGAANMRDMILDELTRVLSMAQGQAM